LTGQTPDPRLAAHAILSEVAAGAYADRVADRRLSGLEERDRRLAMELAYGCLRLRGRLDAELRTVVDRPLERLDHPVLDWLRIGLYQLREMRIPDHAAVSETVRLARATHGRGPAGLVNAVLRRAASGNPEAGNGNCGPVERLSTHGSHPEWLVRRWLERWPLLQVSRLIELDNQAPAVTVRWLDHEPAAAVAERTGLELKPLDAWPGSFRLTGGNPRPLLEVARAVVQDPAASAVVDYASPETGGVFLDACAAPGGKTMGLADGLAGTTSVIAADRDPRRLGLVAHAASRLGLAVECVVMDARRPAVSAARTVLLDAPCTGTGVLRRRPDARWRTGPERLAGLVQLQRELLDTCGSLVAPGGLLVYSTCSLESEENELQVEEFLVRRPEFKREPTEAAEKLPPEVITELGDLFVRPWQYATDGSYAARLRKAEQA
jgi:16S rRNA (cytosine967-C5)-methyltransferase